MTARILSSRPLGTRRLPSLEITLLAMLLGIGAVSAVCMPFVNARDKFRNAVVDAALADPGFVRRAAEAGFRVELGIDKQGIRIRRGVIATCARANEAGPLPCGAFPDDPSHPGTPVEIRP